MSKRLKITGMATLLSLGVLGVIGVDLSRLQAGLEAPTAEVLSTASLKAEAVPAPTPISSHDRFSIDVEDDVTLQVYAREDPKAVANIVMVHGAGSGAWAWEYYFDELPGAYNLYAPSWRGHFDSTPIDDADSADYVRDQAAVMQAVRARNGLPIHVIAHSYGGATTVLLEAEGDGLAASLHLIAPVVPLDYSPLQGLIVPALAPPFIRKSTAAGNDREGTYGGMFLVKERMIDFHQRYAGKNFSKERPSLIAKDGVSADWQVALDEAYDAVGQKDIPVWIMAARYDNVVVPERQRRTADKIGAELITVESGHYIQLDVQAKESAKTIADHLDALIQDSCQ